MLKEFQDAAQAAERKERLMAFIHAIVGMLFLIVFMLAFQYTHFSPEISRPFSQSGKITNQNFYPGSKTKKNSNGVIQFKS
ncbi:MAG: hypothetical protein OQK58_01555 [Gammaproteobacteria bacterium]|nr:hypothetical protein [Gammaproteobacteria bacterium]